MANDPFTLESSLANMSKQDWIAAVEEICEEDGSFTPLGNKHFAAFVEEGTTLLVTFETIQGMNVLSDHAQPLGWEMVRAHGWSHLCIASDGDTWFRDRAVYGHIDRLIDDGFFDEFDRVVFYGAGPCGYAAASYSVAAPGARVLAIQPQATLDSRVTEWDDRFTDMRVHDFTSRYGYAPDMLEAASQAFVLYDPRERLDAMHAALFTHPNVTKLRMRFMGDALQTDLLEMEQWSKLLLAVADDTLNDASFAQLYRERRNYRPYLRNLLGAVDNGDHDGLAQMLCANVADRMGGRKFVKRLAQLDNARGKVAEDA